MTTTLNQVTIDVPLVTEDGDAITTEQGEAIIVDSFSFRTEVNDLPELTPEEAAEFKRGRKLAVTPNGPPKSWEVRILEKSDGTTEYLTVFNLRFLGGRHKSLYRALGQISGTYIRFGSKGIPDSLVGGVYGIPAPTGPFAQLTNFPSTSLPGDVTFQVNAGGGAITAYAWAITDGSTVFAPTTGPSVTETLTEGTWTVACTVEIDGSPVTTTPQTLEVTALAASSVTSSNSTPNAGDNVAFSLEVNEQSLLGDVTWSVEMEVPYTGGSSVFVPVDEDVYYNTVSASGNAATLEFLAGGLYRVTANYEDANGQNAASLSIASQDAAPAAVTSTTHSTNFSSDLANAYRSGDVHMVICGDSINNALNPERFRYGQSTQWAPARWAGTCMINGLSPTYIPATGYESDTNLTNVTANKGAGSGVAGEPYVGSSKLDDPIAARRSQEATYMQFQSDDPVLSNTFGTPFFTSNEWLRDVSGSGGNTAYGYYTGRLQRDEDTFYRASGAETRVAVYGLNDFTLLAKGDTSPQQNVSVTANNYSIITLDRDPSLHTEDSGAEAVVQLDFGAGTNAGEGFGLMDMMSYNSNIDGLSLSYMGNGGWNTANHSAFTEQDRAKVEDNWYNDDAIENHLRMFGFKSAGVLRDNIVVCLWIQNRDRGGIANPIGHAGSMISDLHLWRGRWEAAADAIDASMKANMTFLVCTMPDIVDFNDHEEVGEVIAEVAGQTGFENVALLDLNKKLKTEGIDIREYTGTLAGGLGTQTPLWYASNTPTDGQDADSVHPRGPGSEAMMSYWWDVVVDEIATPSASLSFTLNTPADGDTDDTYTFSPSGSLPADRLVTWFVDGVKTAYGDSFTLPSVAGSFVVRCVIDAADGGQAEQSHTTTIVSGNSAPTSPNTVSVTGNPTTVGDTASITLTNVSDDNTNIADLTYLVEFSVDGGSFSPVSNGPTGNVLDVGGNGIVSASHVCSVEGDYVFRITVSDDNVPVANAPFSSSTVSIAPAPSETLEGTIPFGTLNDNTNVTGPADLNTFFLNLQSAGGSITQGYSIVVPGSESLGIRFFINANATVDKPTMILAFRDMINNDEAELRVITGASTYYATKAATAVATNSVLQFANGWVDENGTAADIADVRSAVSSFCDVEIWTL